MTNSFNLQMPRDNGVMQEGNKAHNIGSIQVQPLAPLPAFADCHPELIRPYGLFLFQSDRAPNDIKGYPGRVDEQGDSEIRALFNRLTTRSSMRANEYLLYLNLVWFKRGKEPDLCLKGL